MVTNEISNLTHEGGNTRVKNVNALGLTFLLLVFGVSALPQENNRTAPQTISASRDQTGQHPSTASVTAQTYGITITCLTAKSDIPNPQPEPTCHVFHSFDRVSVDLKVGGVNMSNNSETVTLTCNGPGNRVQCTAVIAPRSARNSM
jgi:hypothetical protein